MTICKGHWLCVCLAICVWGVSGIEARCQGADDNTHIAVSVKGQKKSARALADSKLSPELLALQRAGDTMEKAHLVGRTSQGQAVVKTSKAKAAALFASPEDAGVVVSNDTENFTPIHRLIISYDKGKRPTDESLRKAGLNVVEDYVPGTFLIVEPIDEDGISVETVNQLAKHKLVTKAYPSYSVKLSPPKPKTKLEEEDAAPAPAKGDPTKRDPAKKIEERTPKTSFIPSNLSISAVPQPKIPTDDRFPDLWGMKAINAPLAWSTVTTSPVIVGVIDTGIDYNHPDLKGNVWKSDRGTHGYNALNRNEDPMDDNGHGTHCAGTIAAMGNNGVGVAGVCWNVQVMGLKFLDAKGRGEDINAIRCIDYAIDHGAKILSNSWGGYSYVPEMEEAIERAKHAGVLFIAAAGNDGNDNNGSHHHFPSSYNNENLIAVMSIDQDGSPSDFSNYGFEAVDLAAPGRDILSTWPDRRLKAISGTSMATPHVSGAAALLWGHSRFKSANWKTIKDELLSDKNIKKTSELDGLCKTSGYLDLEFLAEPHDTPTEPTPCPKKPETPPSSDPERATLVATATVTFQDAKCVTGDDNLLHVQLKLAEPCEVWIRADTSVQSSADLKDLSTGFCNVKDPAKRWQGSARHTSLKGGSWTQLIASHVVTLEPGTHDLYWKVWDGDESGQKLNFNAGTMTVFAVRLNSK